MSNEKKFCQILDQLDGMRPFNDPERKYSRNKNFARDKCHHYAQMLAFILNQLDYPTITIRNDCRHLDESLDDGKTHGYSVTKIEGKYYLTDWTQSQFFGDNHFRGTFADLVVNAQKAQDVGKEGAEKLIYSIYGIRSQEELGARYELALERKNKWSDMEPDNIYGTEWGYTDNPTQHEQNRSRSVDFNEQITSQLQHLRSAELQESMPEDVRIIIEAAKAAEAKFGAPDALQPNPNVPSSTPDNRSREVVSLKK